ncbi:NAD(P)-dependent oxidoreductase [Devosia honganensis]|uniref:NAD(P)-dependent oxidoreductase n=1 Tax=Devosia honganensis TaxID=1610527 RepID=A0ABV7X4P4_9HYPH
MSANIVHQYEPELGERIAARLPPGVKFVPLGASAGTAWTIPPEADVLLVNQNSGAVGLDRSMPAPAGWPFNLKWVHLRSTGIDKYPDWIFQVPQVTVTRGGYATPIAEYVMAAVLSAAKRMPEIWARERSGWHSVKLDTLAGRTLGIVGFGEIGKAIARRALAFDMQVLGTRRTPGPSGMDRVEIVPLEHLLQRSDHIVIATPLTEETRGLFDDAAFAQVKPGAHLINIGRGPVIDTEALRRALDGRLGLATLDVTDPEPPPEGHWLYAHPQVRLSPHISGSSPDTEAVVTGFFLENLERYRAAKPLSGLVDRRARY